MRPDGNDAVSWLQFGCYKLIASVAKRTFRFGREACALVLKADLFERADSALSMRAY
jgi:hypothetical protein